MKGVLVFLWLGILCALVVNIPPEAAATVARVKAQSPLSGDATGLLILLLLAVVFVVLPVSLIAGRHK